MATLPPPRPAQIDVFNKVVNFTEVNIIGSTPAAALPERLNLSDDDFHNIYNCGKFQMRATKVVNYSIYDGPVNYKLREFQNKILADSLKYTGLFSPSAKKNLRKCVDILLQITKKNRFKNPITNKFQTHNLSFITLTLSDNTKYHPQEVYNNLLRPFLQWLSKSKNVKTYLWKLEFQKRGQIHYHITLPYWIEGQEIKEKWLYLESKFGSNKVFFDKNGYYPTAATNIGKVRDIKNFPAYLEKEFIKSIQNENEQQERDLINFKVLSKAGLKCSQPKGWRVWDCSLNLKVAKFFTIEETEESAYHLYNFVKAHNQAAEVVTMDFCTIYNIGQKYIANAVSSSNKVAYKKWKNDILNYSKLN